MSDTPVVEPKYADINRALAAEARQRHRDRRERIATAALQGVMANSSRRGPPWEAAKIAIEVADELILQLDKGPRP